jgi:hypothetical protein
MKVVTVLLLCFLSSALAYTYYEPDPTPDEVQLKVFTDAATALNPTANEIVALDDNGDVLKVDCADRANLVLALQRDTTGGTHKQGSCCLNSHHRICQNIQSQIREKCSTHGGKGDNGTDTSGTHCPA